MHFRWLSQLKSELYFTFAVLETEQQFHTSEFFILDLVLVIVEINYKS